MRIFIVVAAALLGVAIASYLSSGVTAAESVPSTSAVSVEQAALPLASAFFRDPLFVCVRPMGCEAFDTAAVPPGWVHFRKGDIVWPERYWVLHGSGWKKIR